MSIVHSHAWMRHFASGEQISWRHFISKQFSFRFNARDEHKQIWMKHERRKRRVQSDVPGQFIALFTYRKRNNVRNLVWFSLKWELKQIEGFSYFDWFLIFQTIASVKVLPRMQFIWWHLLVRSIKLIL